MRIGAEHITGQVTGFPNGFRADDDPEDQDDDAGAQAADRRDVEWS